MKDLFFLRTCVVLAAVILAGAAALCLLLQAVLGVRPELGQLLGLASDAAIPLEIHRTDLAWLPAWLCPVLSRLLRVEAWVYTAVLLLALPVVLSLGIDWAADRRELAADDEGPLPDQVPRMGRRGAADRLPPE